MPAVRAMSEETRETTISSSLFGNTAAGTSREVPPVRERAPRGLGWSRGGRG